ncbi:leucine-rich repeat-containing protein 23 isoform X2 [Gadus macrocephalus]|uniref:leucine-rich repeat-containing protein 23 isoform X2 n=1 Tax=Gadus macrocephalus TaxID=80720 RepID=UPI0028CBBF64|nr:leucine-rich repeat-containing protein 23 isoform X2 [Gadus macrocephalus]
MVTTRNAAHKPEPLIERCSLVQSSFNVFYINCKYQHLGRASEMDDDYLSEGEGELKEVAEQPEVGPLTRNTIVPYLSLLCRTGNGLAHAFVKLDLNDKKLSDLEALRKYVHLRFLDVSNNHLTDLSCLTSLNQLLWLKIDNNAVSSLKKLPLDQFPYLQWLSLARNQLEDMEGLGGTALENLNLSGNKIQRVHGLQYGQLTNLGILELRGNCLDTTDGIYLPKLRKLYLAQNVIKRLEGLERLELLTTLHLRDNQLETLEGISPRMTSLKYLNVRGNLISNQNALQSLVPLLGTLHAVVILDNPLAESGDYRIAVLTCLMHLERLDKELVSSEERAEAQERLKELAVEEEIPETEDTS